MDLPATCNKGSCQVSHVLLQPLSSAIFFFFYSVLGPLPVQRNPEEVGQYAVAKEGKRPDWPDQQRWARKWEEDEQNMSHEAV